MLNINIPTRGRWEKLANCLRSIDYSGDMCIYIYCYSIDHDIPFSLASIARDLGFKYKVIEDKNILTIESHNIVCKNQGHFLGLSDDIVFHKGAIKRAIALLEDERGLNSDGIVDFTVDNMVAPDGCYMLLGDKFIEKFPERMPYCPEYKFMFASVELRDFAKSIDCFEKNEEAKLDHFHPAVTKLPDATHKRIREGGIIQDDERIYNKRKKSGELWAHNTKGSESNI